MNAQRDLRVLVVAVGLSAGGDLAALSALAVHLHQTHQSGILVALLFAANWLALAVAAPWAGALVDRGDPRRVLLLASLAQAAVAAALAVAPGPAAILALSALLGAGAALSTPAEFTLTGIVARHGAGAATANGRVEAARYAGYLAGPLAGTGLVALAGVGAALAANAATFLVVAGAAAALTARPEPASADERVRPRARDGVMLLAAEPTLRITMAVLAGSLLAMSTSVSADVFFAEQTLGAGSLGLGLLLSAWMAGMLLGSLAVAPRVPVAALALVAILATAVQGSGKLGAAALGVLPLALVLYAVGGAGHGVKNVAARTLIHERVAVEAHGRAFAAYAALRNGAELGALVIGGLLVDALGGRATLLVAGGGTVLIAAIGLATLTRRRTARPLPLRPPEEVAA